jgi:HAD superfamily hydrolase (TIGR01509 family)
LLPKVPYHSIIDSPQTGAIKPESEIFELAQAKTTFEPAELLLIDDARANIMAAERLGWRVLWFDGYRASESVQRVRDALKFKD